jgi:peptidoglycan/xylan/chitin deacetylase (PgdA/CDA1 family)
MDARKILKTAIRKQEGERGMLKFSLLMLLTLPVVGLNAAETREPIGNVTTDQPAVALTFDDGPCWLTPKFLELFKKEGVKATFFECGKSIKKNPELAKRILKEGHEIGNHTISHPHLSKLKTDSEIRKEIAGNQEVIKDAVGVEPKVFRAPFGEHDERVWKVLDELKLSSVMARVDTRDWDNENATVDSITESAVVGTKAGDIILMHIWQQKTLDAMPEIIKRLKAKGYRMVTVSELLAMAK